MPFSTSLRPTLGLGRALNSTARTFSNTASRPIARMIITGRLGAEPELSTTSTGQEIVRYAIATSSGSRDNRQTNWFRVGAFMPDNASREYFLSLPKGYVVLVFPEINCGGGGNFDWGYRRGRQ